MGDPLRVRLAEANAVTGSLLFALVEEDGAAASGRGKDRATGSPFRRKAAPRSAGYPKRR
jgi:hypothetical protein